MDDSILTNRSPLGGVEVLILGTNNNNVSDSTQYHPSTSLLSLKELPAHMTWITDNPFILRHHRPPTSSLLLCLTSCFSHMHSESLNIITHLIPSLLAIYALLQLLLLGVPLSLYSLRVDWQGTLTMDRLFIALALFGIIACFGLSTLFHAFSCHQLYGGHFLAADFIGIVAFGYCVTQATEYFLFYDYPSVFLAFFISNLFFTLICCLLINIEPFSNSEEKWYRAGLFVSYGTAIFSPPLIAFTLRLFTQIDLFTYVMFCFCNIIAMVGGLLYAAKFPESWAPGRYDVWGQSHTTMHICTAVSALLIYQSIILTAEFAIIQ